MEEGAVISEVVEFEDKPLIIDSATMATSDEYSLGEKKMQRRS